MESHGIPFSHLESGMESCLAGTNKKVWEENSFPLPHNNEVGENAG
jgi:hypothetical protein